jgi:hypothetical protein
MFTVHAGVKNSYVDVLTFGCLPQFGDLKRFQSPRQAIFDFLPSQPGVVGIFGLNQLNFLVR